MIYMPEHFNGNKLKKTYKPVDKDLPCDIHIVNLRTMLKVLGILFFKEQLNLISFLNPRLAE